MLSDYKEKLFIQFRQNKKWGPSNINASTFASHIINNISRRIKLALNTENYFCAVLEPNYYIYKPSIFLLNFMPFFMTTLWLFGKELRKWYKPCLIETRIKLKDVWADQF